MKIFMTGATGYVGGVVLEKLKETSHQVMALARNEQSSESLKSLGAEPVPGDISEPERLAEYARESDAVIHLGFIHDFEHYDESVQKDIAAIQSMVGALEGSNKVFLGCSGSGTVGESQLPVEETVKGVPEISRTKSENVVLEAKDRGVRSAVLRLPAFVYGRGGSYFLPILLEQARKSGVAQYVAPGDHVFSSSYVDDVASAYVLGLTQAKAGAIYHPIADISVTYRQLAEAIGENVGCQAVGVIFEAYAQSVGPLIAFLTSVNNPLASDITRKELGWSPKGPSILQEIRTGSYVKR